MTTNAFTLRALFCVAAAAAAPMPAHHDFVRVFKEWVDAGAPCPER